MAYQDGNFTNAIQDGPARIFYPFINAATKDNVTKGTVRNYVVVPSSYTPAAALSTDPADNTQYLVEETDLTIEGGLARYARSYSKVPQTQIEPGTIVLSKPTIPGNEAFPRNFGSYLIVQPDTTLEAYDAYKRANVTSDTGVPGFYPTGGTYTLSFLGNTTSAINYAANAATVQTALNALTPIQNRGNVTVSGTYNSSGGLNVSFNAYNAATLSTSSLTTVGIGTVTSSVSSVFNGYQQTFVIDAIQGQVNTFSPNTANIAFNSNSSITSTITSSGTGLVQNLSIRATQQLNPLFGRDISGLSCSAAPASAPASSIAYYSVDNLTQVLNLFTTAGGDLSGTFTLSIYSQTTAAISYSATAATLKTNIENALAGLSTLANRGSCIVNVTSAASTAATILLEFPPAKLTGGTFTITALGETTSNIAFNTNVSVFQTNISNALNLLSNVSSAGGVTVSGGVITNTNATASIVVASYVFNGGTFTASIFGENTAAIAYNATAATVQAAFNALSNVQSRGNVIISTSSNTILFPSNNQIIFDIRFANENFGSNALALTPAGSSISSTQNGPQNQASIRFQSSTATRTISALNHEISAGEDIYLRNAASVFANVNSAAVTVLSPNSIQLLVSGTETWASVASFTEIGPRTKQGYEPGSVVIRSKTTTDFYLPGVTSGITTADDIPIPVDESGTAAFLQAAFSGQDNINVRVGELRPWKGPILMVDRTSVNADDI